MKDARDDLSTKLSTLSSLFVTYYEVKKLTIKLFPFFEDKNSCFCSRHRSILAPSKVANHASSQLQHRQLQQQSLSLSQVRPPDQATPFEPHQPHLGSHYSHEQSAKCIKCHLAALCQISWVMSSLCPSHCQ